MKNTQLVFKPGDGVKVKPGVKDPDWGSDIGGWQGRILEFEKAPRGQDTVLIQWDSITLQSMPASMIERCEEEGLDWSEMGVAADEVEAADCRDTPRQAEKAKHELEKKYAWVYLGEEGKRINQVLAGLDSEDEMRLFRRWAKSLKENLSFPFEAVVAEFQERGPLRTGDRVRVTGIAEVDDLYGILVDVQSKRAHYVFPLCDLEATKTSHNYQPVKDYAIWFANRQSQCKGLIGESLTMAKPQDKNKLHFKTFWKQFERQLVGCSDEDLRTILRAMAQETLPTERRAFLARLKQYQETAPAVPAQLLDEDLLSEIDDWTKELQAEMTRADEWNEWGGYGDGGHYDDEDSLGPYEREVESLEALFERAKVAFDAGHWELARKAYAKMFGEALQQEDDYGRGIQAQDLHIEMKKASARYLRAVLGTARQPDQPRVLFEQMQQVQA